LCCETECEGRLIERLHDSSEGAFA